MSPLMVPTETVKFKTIRRATKPNPEYVQAYLCWFGSHCFTQDSARLPERRRKKERKKEEDEDEQFAWATISVYHFRNVCQPR